jgi:lipoprotein-anchoring transpeptidase ErfK/SrfK
MLAAVPFHAAAQTQSFEDMVEDALKRAEPLEVPPPTATVPPQSSAPIEPATPGPSPSPMQPPAAVAPAPGAVPSLTAPANPAVSPPPAPATMAQLRVDDVNAATFSDDGGAPRGASPLVLKTQILLDRAGASPGVIDALNGGNVAKAIAAVETVLNLPVDGRLDPQVWAALGGDRASPVLVPYTITDQDVAGPFVPSIPEDYAEQAKLPCLCFTGPAEMFAERFHMDIKLLKALNPSADFSRPGETIVVADVKGQPVTGKIARIEADKGRRQLRAYDAQGRLIVAYPATIGSADNPSPSGVHRVEGIAPNPVYYYDPKHFVQGKNLKKLQLPPGPNNPVGTVWIDLSEPGYGIHGTPEPSRIDKTGSHGCVRLTNWDAEELAPLVDPGVVVEFID